MTVRESSTWGYNVDSKKREMWMGTCGWLAQTQRTQPVFLAASAPCSPSCLCLSVNFAFWGSSSELHMLSLPPWHLDIQLLWPGTFSLNFTPPFSSPSCSFPYFLSLSLHPSLPLFLPSFLLFLLTSFPHILSPALFPLFRSSKFQLIIKDL